MLALLPRRIVPVALAVAVGLGAAPARADDASARWIATLPFGAGQFHRGDAGLGIFFAVGEAVLGGAAIATMVSVEALASTDVRARGPSGQWPDIAALNAEMRTVTTVNRLAFAGWAALAAAGVIEAHVNVGLGRRAAPRDQPSSPVRLTAAPMPGGASVGLGLAF